MIASNHRALNVLFPVSQQGASSLPSSSGMDLSNCFMVLEKSDFELLQVLLFACAARAARKTCVALRLVLLPLGGGCL